MYDISAVLSPLCSVLSPELLFPRFGYFYLCVWMISVHVWWWRRICVISALDHGSCSVLLSGIGWRHTTRISRSHEAYFGVWRVFHRPLRRVIEGLKCGRLSPGKAGDERARAAAGFM